MAISLLSSALLSCHGIQKTHPVKALIKSNVAIIFEERENYFHMQIDWLQSAHTAKKGTASGSIMGRQNFKDNPLETKTRQVKM